MNRHLKNKTNLLIDCLQALLYTLGAVQLILRPCNKCNDLNEV